jgi:hypothetical protein
MNARRLIGYALLFLVFTILLTCYQLIGSNILEAFSGRRQPVIWLSLDSPSSPASSVGSLGYLIVTKPEADFKVIAPPDADLLFTVNGLPVAQPYSDTAAIHFRGVKLREGENQVRVSVQSRDFGRPESTGMTVEYRPDQSSYPVIVTEPDVDLADGHLRVSVMLRPGISGIAFKKGEGDPQFRPVREGMATMDFGAPDSSSCYFIPDEDHPDARWRVWPLPVEPVQTQAGTPAAPSPVKVHVVPERVQKSMTITSKDDTLMFEGHLILPEGSAVLDWARHNEISTTEVFSRIFGLNLDPWRGVKSVDARAFAEMQPFLRWNANYYQDDLPLASINHSPIESSLEVGKNDLVLRASMPLPPYGLAVEMNPVDLPYDVAVKPSNRQNVEVLSAAVWKGDVASMRVEADQPGPLLAARRQNAPAAPSALESDDDEELIAGGEGRVLDYLRNLQRGMPPFLRTILYALLGAVPFLWVLQILEGSGLRPRRAQEISAACLVLLVLHFTIQSASIFRLSLKRFQLADLLHQPQLRYRLDALGSYYPFLAIGMIILLWPIFQTYRRRAPQVVSAWRILLRGLVLAASLAAAILVVVHFSLGDLAFDKYGSFQMNRLVAAESVGVAMLLFWIPLRLCLVFLLGISVPMRAVFAANLAMLTLPATPPVIEFFSRSLIALYVKALDIFPGFIPWQSSQTWWRWIVATLGALLLFQVTKLCLRMSYWKPGMRFSASRRLRWLIVPFMIAAIPAWYATGPSNSDSRSPDVFDFSNFAYSFDSLLPYMIVPAIIAIMRLLNRNDDYRLSATIMSCGSLLFAYYLCGQAVVILFIPIPMIAGYYLFRKFLVVPTIDTDAAVPTVKDFLKKQTDGALAAQRKKTLDKKFGVGDLTYSVYRRAVAQLKSAMGVDDTFRAPTDTLSIFATGAGGGPWRDAIIALKYGIPLSIPFQLLAVVRILRAPAGSFPVIYLIVQVMQTMVLWILISFVFGYFYHAMRGRNGFQKALSFFLAFSFPTVLVQFAVETQALNRNQLIELVQLAAFVLTLALLAFDVKVLSKEGYSWRDLPAAYGVTASAAYLGTLALSLVSTVAEPVLRDWLTKLWSH